MVRSSIIIPTAGRPVAIKSAIQSLLAISPESLDAEIIVVDNNTDEGLAADLYAFCQTLAGRIRYCREHSPGLSAARHRGANEARSELLTFIDDDVEVSETWLPAIQKAFSDPQVAMVGGPSIPKFTCSIPPWFWSYFEPTPYGGWSCGWLSLQDIGRDVLNIDPNLIWGLNFSIRKDVLEDCGGFHPDLVPACYQRWQADGESGLTQKIYAAGYRADYLQNVFLLHLCGADRLNVEYFKKRAYYQGICESYARIRSGKDPLTEPSSVAKALLSARVRQVVKTAWRCLSGKYEPWASEGAQVKKLTDQASREGWLFHQREVAADPLLLAWVRRGNYFGTDVREEKKARECAAVGAPAIVTCADNIKTRQ